MHNRDGYKPWALGFHVTALPLRASHARQRRTLAPGTCHSMASCQAAGPEGAAGCSQGYFLTEPSVKNACTHNTSVPLWLLRNACSLGVQVPLCFKKGPTEASGDQAEALHNMHYFHPSFFIQPTHPASSAHGPPHRESLLSVYFCSHGGPTEPTCRHVTALNSISTAQGSHKQSGEVWRTSVLC